MKHLVIIFSLLLIGGISKAESQQQPSSSTIIQGFVDLPTSVNGYPTPYKLEEPEKVMQVYTEGENTRFLQEVKTYITDSSTTEFRLVSALKDTIHPTQEKRIQTIEQRLYYQTTEQNTGAKSSAPKNNSNALAASNSYDDISYRQMEYERKMQLENEAKIRIRQERNIAQDRQDRINNHLRFSERIDQMGGYSRYNTIGWQAQKDRLIDAYYKNNNCIYDVQEVTSDLLYVHAHDANGEFYAEITSEYYGFKPMLKMARQKRAEEAAREEQDRIEREKQRKKEEEEEKKRIAQERKDKAERAQQLHAKITTIIPELSDDMHKKIIAHVFADQDKKASCIPSLLYQIVQEQVHNKIVNERGILPYFTENAWVRYCNVLQAATVQEQIQLNYLLACVRSDDKLLQNYAQTGLANYAQQQQCDEPALKASYERSLDLVIDRLQKYEPFPNIEQYIPTPAELANLRSTWYEEQLYLEDISDEQELDQWQQETFARLEQRLQAEQQTQNSNAAITNKVYDLDDESAGFLLAQGYNYKKYTQCQGTALQQQFHKEQLEQIQKTKDLAKLAQNQQPFILLPQLLADYIDASHSCNIQNYVAATKALNDTTYSWLAYAGAIAKGVAIGAGYHIAFTTFPALATAASVPFIAAIGCATGVAVYELSKLAAYKFQAIALDNPEPFAQEFTKVSATCNVILQEISNYFKDGITPKVVGDATELATPAVLGSARCMALIKKSCATLIPLLDEAIGHITLNKVQLPNYILRMAGVPENVVEKPTMNLMEKTKETAKKVYVASKEYAKRLYNRWPKIKPIELYQDQTYLQKVLLQMTEIEQVKRFFKTTENLTDFSKLSEVQRKGLELYAWFYENGYKEMVSLLSNLELSIPFQGKNIAIAKEWPLFHSFIGEMPAEWNRLAKPGGGHYNLYGYADVLWKFEKIEEKAVNFIKGNKLFIDKKVYTPNNCVSRIFHHPLEEFSKIICALQNPQKIAWFKQEDKLEFLCHIIGPDKTMYAYTFKLEEINATQQLKLATFYEIKSFGTNVGSKWKNM